MERILGRYRGTKDGPLLVLIGAMHGNEPAGVRAIELLLKMLEVEPITNPDFALSGNIIGLIGNKTAYELDQRFVDRDMNRCWSKETIEDKTPTLSESKEIQEVYRIIKEEIELTGSQEVIVMDLHTTSSHQGIFSIPSESEESLRIAKQLHAPVILGIAEGLKGTSLHFFNKENMGVDCTPIVFESGQHEENLSINRAIAAIINCMRTVNMVKEEHVENVHDKILIEFSTPLPKIALLIYGHGISREDNFAMKPGYVNFSPIEKGDWLANDKAGKILAPYSGRLLMPLYQTLGEDGFFIIKEVS